MPEERDSRTYLVALKSDAASVLLEAFEAAHAGDRASAVAAKAQEAVSCVNPAAASRMTPILDAIRDFEDHDPDFALDDLLAELALGGGGRSPTAGAGIKLASLHKTKGLQWPVVYLLGMEEGHIPDYREEENPVREERRLCFVGVCRAEAVLVLTRVHAFRTFRKKPSRFLDELGL